MNLLNKAGLNRVLLSFGKEVNTAKFASNEQPSTLSSPNDMNKQIKGGSNSLGLSKASMAQVQSYRTYKEKRAKKEARANLKMKSSTPVIPDALKKEIRRAKAIKQDDIAPTV